MTYPTIGSRWDAAEGRPAGFDYLRTVLSASVILWHTIVVCHGVRAENTYWTGLYARLRLLSFRRFSP